MLKACSRCGRIHDFTYDCKVGKQRRFTVTPESKLRSKNAWKIKRADIKSKALYLCEVCKDQDIYNYNNLEIHHVVKLRDDPDGLLEDSNLICLCGLHHTLADSGELDINYLKELIARRDGETDYNRGIPPA